MLMTPAYGRYDGMYGYLYEQCSAQPYEQVGDQNVSTDPSRPHGHFVLDYSDGRYEAQTSTYVRNLTKILL